MRRKRKYARGTRPIQLNMRLIRTWIREYRDRTGRWPKRDSGRIPWTLADTWLSVNASLIRGSRGLPGGTSLAQLLAEDFGVRNRMRLPHFSEKQILKWADAYRSIHGKWPSRSAGPIDGVSGETWHIVEVALSLGSRGLPGGSSLAGLLFRERGIRHKHALPRLTEKAILQWAGGHHSASGEWPKATSGAVIGAPGETWLAIQMALSRGRRGLPGRSSLPKLLARHHGVRNHYDLPPLTNQQILAWVNQYHAEHGRWPGRNSGPVTGAPNETWNGIESSLGKGRRGLPGGSSLARLLARCRGVRNRAELPRLSTRQILAWADGHYKRHGRWPNCNSGVIRGALSETWGRIDAALFRGTRGLPGGSSLARLLARQRGVRNPADLSPLSTKRILAWAGRHYTRHGRWPGRESGPVPNEPHETWRPIDTALVKGGRGLPGGSSLARLLARHRGVRNRSDLPRLSTRQILAWADQYYARHGRWPCLRSGPIRGAPGETWVGIDLALRGARRGLPSGLSLARLLARWRGVRHLRELPPLTTKQILAWADKYYARHGQWPGKKSGHVSGTANESWLSVDTSLRMGTRGLKGGMTLFRLLQRHRGAERAKAGQRLKARG